MLLALRLPCNRPWLLLLLVLVLLLVLLVLLVVVLLLLLLLLRVAVASRCAEGATAGWRRCWLPGRLCRCCCRWRDRDAVLGLELVELGDQPLHLLLHVGKSHAHGAAAARAARQLAHLQGRRRVCGQHGSE